MSRCGRILTIFSGIVFMAAVAVCAAAWYLRERNRGPGARGSSTSRIRSTCEWYRSKED